MTTETKDRESLTSLFARDKDMVISQLQGDRSPDQAVRVLEKETDRLMLCTGETGSPETDSAQSMLRVLKGSLPLVGSVSEAQIWEKEEPGGQKPGSGPGMFAIVCLAAGAAFAVASLILPGSAKLLLLLTGGVLLAAGGYLAGSRRRASGGCLAVSGRRTSGGIGRRTSGRTSGGTAGEKEAEKKQTFLIDPGYVCRTFQGVLLNADHSLEGMRDAARYQKAGDLSAGDGSGEAADLHFFGELLEDAYAARRRHDGDSQLNEQVESIRYYLHKRGIETEDYTPESSQWFQILPSPGAHVTIRPALVKDGVLIMKGIASG